MTVDHARDLAWVAHCRAVLHREEPPAERPPEHLADAEQLALPGGAA